LPDAEDVVKDALGTIGRQVGEDNDDDLVVSIVSASGLSLEQQSLVTAYERDNVWPAPVGDLLRSEPKDLAFQ
jgi:hypothetical protein